MDASIYVIRLLRLPRTDKEYQEPKAWQAVRRSYDNARPRIAVACQTLMQQFNLEKALKGRQFPDENKAHVTVENWFHNQHRCFFSQIIHHTMDQWDTRSNLQGDFV
ncbi:hypothetical protein TNCV_643981 [Trichonephila clavipes]|nr:hypothetical protein TNCV_643981 [Trichonephila clavipes]